MKNAFLCISLMFGSVAIASSAAAQSPQLNVQEPSGARQAAIKSIATFNELVPSRAPEAPGGTHATSAEMTWGHKKTIAQGGASDAIGSPLVDYAIDLDALQNWDGKNPGTLLRPTGQFVYSIRAEGAAQSPVTIAKLKDEWTPITFGSADEAQARDRINDQLRHIFGTKSKTVQVRIPSLHATFIGQQAGGYWQLTPVEDQAALGLKAGTIEPAKKVLLRLQPAAKKLDSESPG